MTALHPLLSLLIDNQFHSGDALGAALGVSRTAVWKQIEQLRDAGLEVYSVKGKGYRLADSVELLEGARIRDSLTLSARHCFDPIETHLSIDSTNSYLLANPRHGAVCLAEHQGAGRGRRGRNWQSPLAQNIYLSLCWHFDARQSSIDGLSLVVGVLVARALAACEVIGVGLKWPNDIYVAGKKLGGILLEAKGELGGPLQVVIGVGLNVGMSTKAAESIDQPWVSLHQLGYEAVGRNQLVAQLLNQLAIGLPAFAEQGLAGFREDWLALDELAGADVSVLQASGLVAGTATGIDDEGALVLQTEAGLRTFMAGDVSVRKQA